MLYLTKINNTFYCRVVVPKDLKQFYPANEIKKSLKTTKKTEARKLLVPLLGNILDEFNKLRNGSMDRKTIITADAVAIFRRLHPGEDTHITIPVMQSFGAGWNVETGSKYTQHPDLVGIQERLNEGWILDAADEWQFVGVQPQASSHIPQAVNLAPQSVERPQTIEQPKPAPPSLMLSEAIELYRAHRTAPEDTVHYKPMSASTLDSDKQALTRLAEWQGKDVPLDSLLDIDYRPFTRFLIGKGLSKKSAHTRLRFTKTFFKIMKDLKYIDTEPTIKYPQLYGKEKLKTANQPYSNREIQLILNYIVENRPFKISYRKANIQLAYLLLMFLYTGFRSKEQLSFTNKKIRKVGEIEVFDFTEMSKGNVASIRMVPLHSRLKALGFMKFAKKQKEKIFPINDSNYRKRFTDILVTLGIKGKPREKTFHSFRATFDSKLQGHIEDSTRKTLMGHTKTGMDKTYLHQLEDEMPMYQSAIENLKYDLDFEKLKTYLTNELNELY